MMATALFVLSIAAGQANSAITFNGTSIDVGIGRHPTNWPSRIWMATETSMSLRLSAADPIMKSSPGKTMAVLSRVDLARCNVGALLVGAVSIGTADLDRDGDEDIVIGTAFGEDYEIIAGRTTAHRSMGRGLSTILDPRLRPRGL